MSSCPGLNLEDFLSWQFDIIIGDIDGNASLRIAEALGTSTFRRPHLTEEQFAKIVSLHEPFRELVEQRLLDFDEENQSWRDYAGHAFDFIPEMVADYCIKLIKEMTAVKPTSDSAFIQAFLEEATTKNLTIGEVKQKVSDLIGNIAGLFPEPFSVVVSDTPANLDGGFSWNVKFQYRYRQ